MTKKKIIISNIFLFFFFKKVGRKWVFLAFFTNYFVFLHRLIYPTRVKEPASE